MYAPLQRIELHRKLRPLLIDWSRHDQRQLEARSFIMKFRLSMSFPWAFFSLWVTLWYKAINFVSKRATTWARPRNNFNDRNLRKAVRQETLEIMALLLMPLKRGERSEFQFFAMLALKLPDYSIFENRQKRSNYQKIVRWRFSILTILIFNCTNSSCVKLASLA